MVYRLLKSMVASSDLEKYKQDPDLGGPSRTSYDDIVACWRSCLPRARKKFRCAGELRPSQAASLPRAWV